MPTILFVDGFRFFFYSNENDEPIHIHIQKSNTEGKIWLEPEIKIAYMHDFSSKEERQIMEITSLNIVTLKQKWNEYFA